MDAFFAAVEERDHPEFRGMPVVVGADPKEGRGRGVVSTANYEARKYGIGSAMPISRAWSLCQEGERNGGKACVFFGGVFGKYGAESRRVMAVIEPFTKDIEQAGLDEAYFTTNDSSFFAAGKTAKRIKTAIKRETKLTASIGIGPNKLIAKIASDVQKPDGLTVVLPDDVKSFLDPLPLSRIPGIGPKAVSVLAFRGAKTVQEARRFGEEELTRWFGKWGSGMHRRLRGTDDHPLEIARERKSLGHETTFMEDARDPMVLMTTLKSLAKRVGNEVHESGLLARRITLRIRFDDFTTLTRQTTLERATDAAETFEKEAMKLFLPFLDARENPNGRAFRLLGVRAGELTAEQPLGI